MKNFKEFFIEMSGRALGKASDDFKNRSNDMTQGRMFDYLAGLMKTRNHKQLKKPDSTKFSAFGGLDSLLSISEMPTGSPVVTVGINKSANAAIYALKILANENSTIKRKLKNHKFEQHSSVIKESDELKKLGLAKFVKKKFK